MNNIQVAPANSWLQLVLGLRSYIYYILYRPVEGELCCIKKCDEVVRNPEIETSESLPERAARGDGGAEIETMLCYNLNLLPGRYRLGVRTEDSQSSNPGSIPGSATKSKGLTNLKVEIISKSALSLPFH